MAKLILKPLTWDFSLPYSQNLANAINGHWHCLTAYPVGPSQRSKQEGEVDSDMIDGVPPMYRNRSVTHPDILWFYKDDKGKWRVR